MNLHPGCYPGLYSLWGFAPPLLVTMAAAHSAGLFSYAGFAPYCLYCGYYTLLWAVCFWGFSPSLVVTLAAAHCTGLYSNCWLRPSFDRNHICRNTHNFLCSLGVLSDTTEFHVLSRHVRIGSCYSVATIKIFVRCIVTGCEVETRIFL